MKSQTNTKNIIMIFSVLTLFILFVNVLNKPTSGVGYNDNTSILTKLNVSNEAPTVTSVLLYDNNSQTDMILEQGAMHIIICNSTVNDTNGVGDIALVNATLYKYPEYGPNTANDNNFHYSNSSCTQTSTFGVMEGSYTCKFHVWYYADNGTWACNVTAKDNSDATNYSYDTSNIDPLYALNLSVTEIDFGELAPNEISTDQGVNVTNFGNMDLGISVKGYGVVEGDSLAMNCSVGNISISSEKFSLATGTAYSSMASLTSSFASVSGLTIPQRIDDNDNNYLNSTNSTFWKIRPPYGTKGVCNGTIVFSAESP